MGTSIDVVHMSPSAFIPFRLSGESVLIKTNNIHI